MNAAVEEDSFSVSFFTLNLSIKAVKMWLFSQLTLQQLWIIVSVIVNMTTFT